MYHSYFSLKIIGFICSSFKMSPKVILKCKLLFSKKKYGKSFKILSGNSQLQIMGLFRRDHSLQIRGLSQAKSIDIFLISPQKHMFLDLISHLSEALLMSTHNMFLWRNKKILAGYPLLSGAMRDCYFLSKSIRSTQRKCLGQA